MALDLATALALATTCAPQVSPLTLLAVAKVESGFDSLAIGVNARGIARPRPANRTAAIREAEALIAAGRNIDLGLAQINVRNLPRLKLTVAEAFDPCRNLQASASILREGYRNQTADPQRALRAALSAYNTGHPGSITTIHANSAELAFDQLTLLVKESEAGRHLSRADIGDLLRSLVDIVVQVGRTGGSFQVSEVWDVSANRRLPRA